MFFFFFFFKRAKEEEEEKGSFRVPVCRLPNRRNTTHNILVLGIVCRMGFPCPPNVPVGRVVVVVVVVTLGAENLLVDRYRRLVCSVASPLRLSRLFNEAFFNDARGNLPNSRTGHSWTRGKRQEARGEAAAAATTNDRASIV